MRMGKSYTVVWRRSSPGATRDRYFRVGRLLRARAASRRGALPDTATVLLRSRARASARVLERSAWAARRSASIRGEERVLQRRAGSALGIPLVGDLEARDLARDPRVKLEHMQIHPGEYAADRHQRARRIPGGIAHRQIVRVLAPADRRRRGGHELASRSILGSGLVERRRLAAVQRPQSAGYGLIRRAVSARDDTRDGGDAHARIVPERSNEIEPLEVRLGIPRLVSRRPLPRGQEALSNVELDGGEGHARSLGQLRDLHWPNIRAVAGSGAGHYG